MIEKIKKYDIEKVMRNCLIILTLLSFIIVCLNFTHLVYIDQNIDQINDFLLKYVNGPFLWITNILLYIVAIIYMIAGIKSKQEVALKVSFSLFSMLTTIISMTLIINWLAELFQMFH